MKCDEINTAAGGYGLQVLGELDPSKADTSLNAKYLALLGPAPNFWDVFSQSDEYRDNAKDPIDRWSKRVIEQLAESFGAKAILPFEGPPYAPFLTYALQSQRAFSSHVGMLVHDLQGLMISYRGALAFDEAFEFTHAQSLSPCETCASKPCATACPVGALTPSGYDVKKCKDFLNTSDGKDCLIKGCAVRRICPISKGAQRKTVQSALHMRAFRGA